MWAKKQDKIILKKLNPALYNITRALAEIYLLGYNDGLNSIERCNNENIKTKSKRRVSSKKARRFAKDARGKTIVFYATRRRKKVHRPSPKR